VQRLYEAEKKETCAYMLIKEEKPCVLTSKANGLSCKLNVIN